MYISISHMYEWCMKGAWLLYDWLISLCHQITQTKNNYNIFNQSFKDKDSLDIAFLCTYKVTLLKVVVDKHGKGQNGKQATNLNRCRSEADMLDNIDSILSDIIYLRWWNILNNWRSPFNEGIIFTKLNYQWHHILEAR